MTNSQSRRRFVTSAGASAALFGLTGYTGHNAANVGKQGTQVKFWSSPNKQELQFHKKAATAFEKDHQTKIDVRPVPEGDSSEQVVLSALASGTEPDVFANVFPGFAAKLAANNAAKNLYEIDGVEQFLQQRCGKTILQRYEAPGQDSGLYQAPWKANPVLFQYNDTVFQNAGFQKSDYPGTLSGLIEAGKTIVKQENAAKFLWDRAPNPTWYERWFDFLPLYLAASKGQQSMLKRESGKLKPAFNNDAAVKVLQFFQDLYQQDLAPTQSGEKPLFAHNNAAINTGGPWVIPYFTGVNKDIKMTHRNPPVPEGVESNSHTYADPKNQTIFSSAKNPGAAWSFINLELQQKWDTRFLEQTLQLPLRKGLVDSAKSFFEKRPALKPYAQALETSHPPEYTPNYSKFMNEFGKRAFVPVARGQKSPKQGLKDAESAVARIVG